MRRARAVLWIASIGLLAGLLLGGCALLGTGGPGSTSTSGNGTTISSTTTGGSGPTITVSSTTTLGPTSTVQPSTTVSSSTTIPYTVTTVAQATNYTRLPTKDKVVALTFDAAYDPTPLKAILAALQDAGAQATFFLTGEFVRDFPKWTQEIIDRGYPIGNHSYTHPDFTKLSEKEMRSEIEKTAAAIVTLGGDDPRPLFRAPYGSLNKKVLSVLGSEGYVSVFWTIDTLDWETDRTPAQIEATVLKHLQPGAIILMHVGSKQEAQILPKLLSEIKAKGYGFVNLRQALTGAGG